MAGTLGGVRAGRSDRHSFGGEQEQGEHEERRGSGASATGGIDVGDPATGGGGDTRADASESGGPRNRKIGFI